jgi:organic radical activating enzyme
MSISADSFCIGPWAEIRINSNGSLNYCHFADNAMLPPEDSILSQGLDDYFHKSQTIKNVREDLMQGRQTSRCHRCYKEENIGCTSFRQRRNIQSAIFPGRDFEQSFRESRFTEKFHSDSKPRFYHVSFSNLCNMACMMCNQENSTRFDDFGRRAGIITSTVAVKNDWTTGTSWKDFCEHLISNQEIVCLHIMGGEPMYHKKFRELLEFLIDHQHTNFHFTFVTNGSIYQPDVIRYLEKFRSVVIEISIESLGACNDYVRHGSDTDLIVSNIKRFLAHRSDTFDVVLRTVPQALTVLDYHKVLEFGLENNIVIDSNALHNPGFLHSSVLSEDIKKQVRQSLEPFLCASNHSITEVNLRNRGKIESALSTNAKFVLAHLDNVPDDLISLRYKLAQYCSAWDKTRGYHARDYVPALYDFLQQHGYEL